MRESSSDLNNGSLLATNFVTGMRWKFTNAVDRIGLADLSGMGLAVGRGSLGSIHVNCDGTV